MISFPRLHFTESKIIPWLYGLIILGLIFRFCYPFFSHPLDHIYSDPARHYSDSHPINFGGQTLESAIDPPLPQLVLMAAFLSLVILSLA